jgi:hypothetical protein
MRRVQYLQAQPKKERVQVMRRIQHLRVQLGLKKILLQTLRRLKHWTKHLRAQLRKKQMKGLPEEGFCAG